MKSLARLSYVIYEQNRETLFVVKVIIEKDVLAVNDCAFQPPTRKVRGYANKYITLS